MKSKIIEHDHDAIWFAEFLEYNVAEMRPREQVIVIKHSRESAKLLAKNLRQGEATKDELLEAAKAVYELIESGWLVRDISKDSEPDFALRQIEPVRKLKMLNEAIAKAEGPKS